MSDAEEALRALGALHSRIDLEAAAISTHHGPRLHCKRGCQACCVDDLTVFEIEAQRIRQAHPELLASGTPHPEGACAFLDAEGACRVYEDRPYVCRTQGLPLRWLDEDAGQVVERRDICQLNEEGSPLESLDEDACWTLGPVEGDLAALEARRNGGNRIRVRLRSLFRS